MKRRRVYFYCANGEVYVTPEFNGDKSEFIAFGSLDRCDKDWSDIIRSFAQCQTLSDFERVNEQSQRLYHSILGDVDILPVEKVTSGSNPPSCDEEYHLSENTGENEDRDCFTAEPNNPYPLCVGKSAPECMKCCIWKDYPSPY